LAETKKGIDKWKKKKWFSIQAPEALDRTVLGQTPAEKPELLKGRIVRVNARDLGRPTKRSHLDLYFKIIDVQAQNALTQWIGLEAKPGAIKRLIRRRSSKIETSQIVQTKDNQSVRVKLLAIGLNKMAASQETAVRNTLTAEMKKIAQAKPLEQLLGEIVYGNIPGQLNQSIRKIAPVKKLEVLKARANA